MNTTPSHPVSDWVMQQDRPELVRPSQRVLAGVSKGLADHLGVSVFIIRICFVILTFGIGFGLMLYIWLWIFVPAEYNRGPIPSDTTISRKTPVALFLGIATLAMLVIMYYQYPYHSINAPVGALAMIFLTGSVMWSLFLDPKDPNRKGFERFFSQQLVPTVALLYSFAAVMSAVPYLAGETMVFVVYLVMFLYTAFLLIAAPMYRLAARKISERELRLRLEERSSMAAHLHDGVMQSLALIQNRAGPQTEVGRIARAQERALRDWLFGNHAPITGTVTEEIREIASLLELEYMATFEIVTVGEPLISADTKRELLAAIKEAMLNAAKHAGGAISLYIEGSRDSVEVNIRDRGTGFDIAALPQDRFGVRESLIGRVERLGGKTKVTSSEYGTEIRITIPILKTNGQFS